jgi:arylsulfatase A-like enzyme
MLLRYPNVVQPGAYDDLVEGTDLLATLFDLCGLPIPSQNQGRSFAERITGGARGGPYTPREYAFSENIIPEGITHGNLDMPYVPGKGVGGIVHPDAKMVRSKRFKYCHYVGHSSELYDLQADPLEIRNLAGDPRYADVADRMKTALLDWMITADETEQIAPRWCDI